MIEANGTYVLPAFTKMCVAQVQTSTLTATLSIIGGQGSAYSVIGDKIGANQYATMLKNSVNNAYIKNSHAGTVLRAMIMYC